MKVISDFLQKNSEHRPSIHVIGDSIVDEYFQVKVTRISPESPNVCVMLSATDAPFESLPGGAANICYQLKNFNVNCKLFSWVDDAAYKVFEQVGMLVEAFTRPECINPRKKRFFDGDIQVGDRWDVEVTNCGITELEKDQNHLYSMWHRDKQDVSVVILSDYNKGIFVNNKIPYIKEGIVTIVDPKKGPISKWKGCTIFKPNTAEAIELSNGLTEWHAQCDYFSKELGCQSIVITQGGMGVVGWHKTSGYFEYHCSKVIAAQKPVGAGDCFIGILALAISHGFTVEQAAQIAFEAGALYVERPGRGSVTPWQLQKQSKFVSSKDLCDRNFKLVFTNGCFDILHTGHLESLRFAKSKGDKLIVAVNSDDSVSRLKGLNRPVVPLIERMEMLAALECVDYVVNFEDDSPLELIKEMMPDVLVKGADWVDKPVAGTEYVKEVYFVPLVVDKSTTNIIEKIKNF